MARVKGGYTRKNRRKKILKLAKGYFGSKRTLYKTANEQVMRSLAYSYRDRKQRKREFRKLWITRINAAARLNGLSYSRLTNGLKLSGIEINRKMLADIAVTDEQGFAEICKLAKEGLDGKAPAKTSKPEVKKAAPKKAAPKKEEVKEAPKKEQPKKEAPKQEETKEVSNDKPRQNNEERAKAIYERRMALKAKRDEARRKRLEEEMKNIKVDEIKEIVTKREEGREFAEIVMEAILKNAGNTVEDLAAKYGLKTNLKAINRSIISAILAESNDLENDPRFDEANIKLKTVKVNKNGKIANPMSFASFRFNDIVAESWETSYTRKFFKKSLFIITLFQEEAEGTVLADTVLWNMPTPVLSSQMRETRDEVVKLLNEGNVVKSVDGDKVTTNFPKNDFNSVSFVAPHAQNNKDTDALPVVDKVSGKEELVKHSYWLTRNYLREILGLELLDGHVKIFDEFDGATPKVAAVKEKVAKHDEAVEADANNDYSKMTVSELKAIAKEKGVKGISSMKKAELVDALNNL